MNRAAATTTTSEPLHLCEEELADRVPLDFERDVGTHLGGDPLEHIMNPLLWHCSHSEASDDPRVPPAPAFSLRFLPDPLPLPFPLPLPLPLPLDLLIPLVSSMWSFAIGHLLPRGQFPLNLHERQAPNLAAIAAIVGC